MRAVEQCCREALAGVTRGGASLSVWQRGRAMLSLSCGEGWEAGSLVPVFSVTKLISAAVFLRALRQRGLDESLEIGELWPRFPLPRGTVAQLLSHQLGLASWARRADLFDLDDCRVAVEESRPVWRAPELGYHAHTMGPLVDILMRELTGERLCDFWERDLRAPHGLELYLGDFSSDLYARIKRLSPPRLEARGEVEQEGFYRAYLRVGTETYAAFHALRGLESVRAMNEPRGWHCGDPAKGAIASASGVARFYQLLMDESVFAPEILQALSVPQARGFDRILQQPMCYGSGSFLDMEGVIPRRGLGHAGAGGAHACGQLDSGISFAYVMDQMEWGLLPSARVRRVVEAISCAAGCGV